MVKPTLDNLLLWRSTYISNGTIYIDAVRLGFLDQNKIYEGESVNQFVLSRDMPDLKSDSALHQDITRFSKFSDNFVAYDPTQNNVLGDIRYSMLATSVKPLWGIVIDQKTPDIHADYQFFRDSSKGVRQEFVDMLLGRGRYSQDSK